MAVVCAAWNLSQAASNLHGSAWFFMVFHLHEWRICELGKPPGDLCFAASRGPNHEDVLRDNLALEVVRHTLATPAIACGPGLIVWGQVR